MVRAEDMAKKSRAIGARPVDREEKSNVAPNWFHMDKMSLARQ